MAQTNQTESVFEETYREALKSIGGCYNGDELLAYNQLYIPALVYFETGITKGADSHIPPEKDHAVKEMWRNLLKIASSLTIEQTDSDYLTKVALWLGENGFVKMSGVIELFLLTVQRFTEEPPLDSHCHFDTVTIECERCHFESNHLFWNIINTTLREDLHQLVRSGEFFQHRCPYCGQIDHRCGILFYCDPDRDEYLLMVPPAGEEERKMAEDGTQKYLDELGGDFRANKSNVAFVSRYVAGPWKNAEDFNIVSHVQDPRELMEITNAHLNFDQLITTGNNILDPTYMTADYEFRAKNYKKAVSLYAKAFLNNQKQVPWLYNISAALQNLGRGEKATALKSRADALRLKLRETGVMFDGRDNWPLNQTQQGGLLTVQIDKTGLPSDWGFGDVILTLRELAEDA
jgi:hypothetical protein